MGPWLLKFSQIWRNVVNVIKMKAFQSVYISPRHPSLVICYRKMLKSSEDNTNFQETKSMAPIICAHVRGKFDSSEWTKTRKITGVIGLVQ